MIEIKKSNIGFNGKDNANRQQLIESTKDHMRDVSNIINFFIGELEFAADHHDEDKLYDNAKEFWVDFISGFRKGNWYSQHVDNSRHHITNRSDYSDVNLFDVLEMIADCAAAGMARSGKVYKISLPTDILQKAFNNTVKMVLDNIVLIDE